MSQGSEFVDEGDADESAPTADGEATRRTDDERVEAARVDDTDIADGVRSWHKHAPRKSKGLIDATAEDG